MSRKIDAGRAEIFIIPQSLAMGAEREIEAGRARVFLVYPDTATPDQVTQMIRAATAAVKAAPQAEEKA